MIRVFCINPPRGAKNALRVHRALDEQIDIEIPWVSGSWTRPCGQTTISEDQICGHGAGWEVFFNFLGEKNRFGGMLFFLGWDQPHRRFRKIFPFVRCPKEYLTKRKKSTLNLIYSIESIWFCFNLWFNS